METIYQFMVFWVVSTLGLLSMLLWKFVYTIFWEHKFLFLLGEIHINYLEFFHTDLSLLPICVFISSFLHISVGPQIFGTLGYHPILLCHSGYSNRTLCRLLCHFVLPHHFVSQALPYFPAVQDAPGLSCIFLDPVLELAISSFIGEHY